MQWVYEAAARCNSLTSVIVATDNREIAARVRDFGGVVELTRSDHLSGTDRVAEVAHRHPEFDVVVNVQGDQPFVSPEMLDALVAPYYAGERPDMTTLACPLVVSEWWSNPNVVKVVRALDGTALYFSRSPIPYDSFRSDSHVRPLHHLGLYAFTRETLVALATLPATPLEHQERLEQLRALEHGVRIRVCETDRPLIEMNTPDDLELARSLVRDGKTWRERGSDRRRRRGWAASPLLVLAGPCVVRTATSCCGWRRRLAALRPPRNTGFVFKASFDKANRSSAAHPPGGRGSERASRRWRRSKRPSASRSSPTSTRAARPPAARSPTCCRSRPSWPGRPTSCWPRRQPVGP